MGIDAKCDIYNNFDPLKQVSICLNPPSTKEPPLVELKQEGKDPVYATDFYFTNKEPSDLVIPAPGTSSDTPAGDETATVDPTVFNPDPLQPGKICLYSWSLYTPQAQFLI